MENWEKAFEEAMEHEGLDIPYELREKYRHVLEAVAEAYLEEVEKVIFRAGYLLGEMDAEKAGKE